MKKKARNSDLKEEARRRLGENIQRNEQPADKDSLRLYQELQVHEIELELQNEELLKTKEKLEEAIDRYNDFYNHASVAYFTIYKSGSILEANLTGTVLLNTNRSDLIGQRLNRFVSPGSKTLFDNVLKKVFEEGKSASVQLVISPENSEEIHVDFSFSRPVDGIKCLLVATDITEIVKTENELVRTRNYFELLINYANAPIIVWNPVSQIILFNKAFERLTGYASDEVLGRKLDFLFPDPTISKSRSMIQQTLFGDFWESIEIPILCSNGETKIVLWNSANIYDKTQNLISTIAQGNDITSRKRAEIELEESRRKLELALENGNIGIWEYDIKTRKLTLDERMRTMMEIRDGSFDGTLTSLEKYLHEEDIVQVREAFRKVAETNEPFETLFRVKHSGYNSKYVMAKGTLYSDPGEPLRIMGVSFDITEMKKGSERALFRLNEELARSNRELEQFAYVASHDLQEPLRMVSSFTQMLAQRYGDKLDENARDYIKYAVDGSKRMYDLINGLLAYSRIQTKGDYFAEADINEVIREVLRNLEFIIEKRKAVINIDKMPVIRADRNQMIQLFQNLVTNGIKFSNGTPKITISVRERPDNYLFSVKDEGIGIDQQYYERIFQIFQRLFTKEEYEGTGIGLSICKRIVERHGGKIWVKSKPGEGSNFMFTIKKEL